ncbi:MAG TPA: DsbA family protein [Hyphomicrobiaceae bacterium]|nr:DsbA family protein [Hyphomicrobiaceae bacterium]
MPTKLANSLERLLGGLTSTKGALLAAPIVLGTGLLLAIAGGNAGQTAQNAATATSTPSPAAATVLAQAAVTAPTATAKAGDKATGGFSAEQEKEIGAIVRRYLLANPQVLVDVSKELERQQSELKSQSQLKLISNQKNEIFRSPLDFVMGNPKGDVTIVEYFDYNCGWCKRALGEVSKLAEQDPNVRIVMKEFPIFGEHSEFAARAAMASNAQGKYWDFHVALMKEKRVTKENTLTIAASVGIDVDKLKVEMEKPKYMQAIKQNGAIAQALGIEGTPGFIMDGRVNPGFMPVASIKQTLAEIRKSGCQVC